MAKSTKLDFRSQHRQIANTRRKRASMETNEENRARIYKSVKAITTDKDRKRAMLEELLELKEATEVLINGLATGKYNGNRHGLSDDVMSLWSEMADVLNTTEQNLETTAGNEYLGLLSELALKKLEKHLENGTLLDGLPELSEVAS